MKKTTKNRTTGSSQLFYKDWVGSIEYSKEDKCYFGQVQGIKATILYEGEDEKELEQNFISMIKEYIETCETNHLPLQKSYDGVFSHINSALRKKILNTMKRSGYSFDKIMNESLKTGLEKLETA
ncbi:MAG: hypothetical protein ACLVKO_02625 [Dysgonomonas sp.]